MDSDGSALFVWVDTTSVDPEVAMSTLACLENSFVDLSKAWFKLIVLTVDIVAFTIIGIGKFTRLAHLSKLAFLTSHLSKSTFLASLFRSPNLTSSLDHVCEKMA
jgi:hypothetical protein